MTAWNPRWTGARTRRLSPRAGLVEAGADEPGTVSNSPVEKWLNKGLMAASGPTVGDEGSGLTPRLTDAGTDLCEVWLCVVGAGCAGQGAASGAVSDTRQRGVPTTAGASGD
eukprot:3702295-Pyramimonas_sp.AAC.1